MIYRTWFTFFFQRNCNKS